LRFIEISIDFWQLWVSGKWRQSASCLQETRSALRLLNDPIESYACQHYPMLLDAIEPRVDGRFPRDVGKIWDLAGFDSKSFSTNPQPSLWPLASECIFRRACIVPETENLGYQQNGRN
jgi:hypothetical protein